MNKYVLFVSMGFELIGLIIVAVYLGGYLEEKFVFKKGLLQALLILFFLIGWFVRVIYQVKSANANTKTSEPKKPDSHE